LSLGFAGLVFVLLLAIGAGRPRFQRPVQLAIQVVVLAIIPLL